MPNLNEISYLLGQKTNLTDLCEGLSKNITAIPPSLQKRLAQRMKAMMKAEQSRMNKQAKAIPKKAKTKSFSKLSDFPDDLQGLPSNKYGGCQLQRLRGFKGGSYGPVNKRKRAELGSN